MREFFVDEVVKVPFQMFGSVHFFITVATIVLFAGIVFFRNEIKKIPDKWKERIRIFILLVLYLNMAIYYNGYAHYGVYNVKVHLPLHLCFIGGFSFMYALLTKNVKVYKFAYFISFVGPLPAMIWPDLKSVDSYVFFQYIISHHFYLLSTVFIYYLYDIKITKKDMWKIFWITNGIILFMAIFNQTFGTNYIMLKGLPERFLNLYPFLRNLDHPILLLELSGIIGMYISYLFAYYNEKGRN